MRLKLKHQLFLAFLLTGGLLIALMAVIGSWSFDRGFIAYVNDIERQRLDPVVEALAAGHAREGDWRWVTAEDGAWRSLLEEHLGVGRRSPPPGARDERQASRDELRPDPPPRPGDGAPRRPPDDGDGTLTLDPRLLLADAERRVLIGRARSDRRVRWQPIDAEGRTVGYLGYRQRDTLAGELDQAFAAQQRRSFLYAALAMTVLSALLAVALADRLVRPLQVVNDAVARIGRGQYAHRVPDGRGDEIGDLSRRINALAATLEKNLDARRRWLAEISHELRTPVAVLQGELEAIQDGVTALDEEAVASLHAETLRLARLIDDLRDLTLSDAGALDYRVERLDLGEVLAKRVAAARHRVEAASLTIAVTPSPGDPAAPLPVDGDVQRLGQLADNLLQNSLRYTDPGGEIRVALSRADGRAVVDWSDSGPGVDDAQLERLFEPLYRADPSRSRERGGAGLGLAIVRRIVEAHGGTITASHAPLGGLALRVELPLAREDTA